MASRSALKQHLRVGRPDVEPSAAAHTPGVREGNAPGNYRSMKRAHLPDGRSTARRSTGVNPEQKNPILAAMPNLSPA